MVLASLREQASKEQSETFCEKLLFLCEFAVNFSLIQPPYKAKTTVALDFISVAKVRLNVIVIA